MKRPSELGQAVIACILFWVAVAVFILLVASCGGTFVLRSDGSVSYTTPEILKPKIEVAK